MTDSVIQFLQSEEKRAHISSALFALALATAFLQPGLDSRVLPFVWLFLGGGIYFAYPRWSIGNRCVFAGLLVIIGSAWVAIPLIFINGRAPASTLTLALLTTPLLLYYLTDHGTLILKYLSPLWFIQATYVLWQGLVLHIPRAPGFAENTNAGSAFLMLGIIFLLDTRYKWLTIPLACAIPFSGSRWVAVVGAAMLGLLILKKYIPWRTLAPALVVAMSLVVVVNAAVITASYRGAPAAAVYIDRTADHANQRIALPPETSWATSLLPWGFVDSNLHNVPLRMMVETGLPSALAWLLILGYLTIKSPHPGSAVWMLLSVGLLSIMYYHTWVGPLGGLWWLLVGIRVRQVQREAEG